MPIELGIPLTLKDPSLGALLLEILRRAPDGSVVPLFVDQSNQRVLIGATSASATPIGKLEVNGDIKVVSTTGSGLILPNKAGSRYYRLTIDDPQFPLGRLNIQRVS